MTPSDAKVAIRQSQTREGVYDALAQMGVNVCSTYSIDKRLKECRSAYQHEKCEAIQVAKMRLTQIDNKEV